jgi:4-hydroxybenzoate polyprenyltransferase
MTGKLRDLITISRPEFLPANSASLVIGVAWGLTLPTGLLWGLVVPLVLSYAVITLVAAYAAQINSLSDYELDLKDESKIKLTEAVRGYDRRRLRAIMYGELILSLLLLVLLIWVEGKPELLFFWAAAVFLAQAYSAPPLRLKSRGLLAVLALLMVLSVLPITFVSYVFNTHLTVQFLLFLLGQASTVYGVIIPAEIRDYFGDRKMGVVTMTVQIGLTKASLLGITLLSVGGTLVGTGLVWSLLGSVFPILNLFLVGLAGAYVSILVKYWKLYTLSRKLNFLPTENDDVLEQDIVNIAIKNPKWITLVTQAIVLMCVVLLASKIIH